MSNTTHTFPVQTDAIPTTVMSSLLFAPVLPAFEHARSSADYVGMANPTNRFGDNYRLPTDATFE